MITFLNNALFYGHYRNLTIWQGRWTFQQNSLKSLLTPVEWIFLSPELRAGLEELGEWQHKSIFNVM